MPVWLLTGAGLTRSICCVDEGNRMRTRGWETRLKFSQIQVLRKAGRPFHLI